jgi:hypothetical protein
MSETYLYSINRVINIDNGSDSKKLVIATDSEKIYKNLVDPEVTSQCRIIGGAWTDDLVVNNIVCHPASEDTSYSTHTNNVLNIALAGNDVNMNGKNVNITSVEDASTTNVYGKTINIGEDVSTTTIKTNIMNITTAGQESTTNVYGKTLNMSETSVTGSIVNLYGKTLNVGEDDTVTTIKSNNLVLTTAGQTSTTRINGKTLIMAESGVAGSTTTVNGKTLTMGEDDTITTLKSNTTVLTTANQNSTTTIYGKEVKLGENNRADTELTVFGKTINIGDDTNTDSLNVYGNVTFLKTDTSLITETNLYTLNSEADGAYLKIEKNANNGKAQIDMGSLTNTEQINLKAQNIDINAANNLSLATNSFEFNKDSQKAYFEINDLQSRITIGRSQLDNTYIHGSNVYIGEPGCTTTIYGNVISYSEGSNITTNTVTQETSAFHIHNTGTKTAFTVIQDNSVSGGGYDLVNFFTQENQDRSPFRVDHIGRVGLGVETNVTLKAWLHINRNDPDISSVEPDDLLLIEDKDNDATPFIIKKEGDVGIGTDVPRYKLDVWSGASALNGQENNDGNINGKGIALRDVVYIKQNHTNRIMYALGNKLYTHPVNDFIHSCVTGFTFSWNKTNIAYANTDNTGFDPFAASDDGTFIFRMTCKLHIAGNDGHIAYRRFEIFVNPQNNVAAFSKEMPAHVTVADLFDSSFDHYEFPIEPIVKKISNDTCQLQIKWKLRNTTGNAVMPTTSRAYLDVEFFGHENIGDIKADPLNAYDVTNDGTLTLV